MEKKTPRGGDLRRRMIQQQKLFYVIEMLQFVFGDSKTIDNSYVKCEYQKNKTRIIIHTLKFCGRNHLIFI